MNSSVIGKIEKARRYAQERERMKVTALEVSFHGDNDDHKVSFDGQKWHCTCDFFANGYNACAHTMALERVLDGMMPAAADSGFLEKAGA